MNLFETPGKLTIPDCKTHCDPKWADGIVEANVQFCIKSNIFYLFVRNSCDQSVMDNLWEEKHRWTIPGSGDGGTLLIAICSKNVHGTRASAAVANVELLSMRTKDFRTTFTTLTKIS